MMHMCGVESGELRVDEELWGNLSKTILLLFENDDVLIIVERERESECFI